MRRDTILLAALLLLAQASAFSIDSYYTNATVRPDGGLDIRESIDFTLEREFSEGFRSIRREDFCSLDGITVRSVTVNGENVPFGKQMNGEQAEIVWRKTFAGKNHVELDYSISGRALVYDDFAKVCFEHFGAGWSVPAKEFEARMTLPEAARSHDMHFEVYSAKEGSARIEDLTVVIGMEDVPPGNYVGGCYLYHKGALAGGRLMNGSALQMLKDEREAYGSKTLIEAEDRGSSTLCCLPAAIASALAAAFMHARGRGRKKLPENIIPPGREQPAFVSVLVRNRLDYGDAMAASILDLINRGVLDIVELEKRGETSAEARRGRTILLLKRKPKAPEAWEAALLDMLFPEGAGEVDLDRMAAGYAAISGRKEAKADRISAAIERYNKEVEAALKRRNAWELRDVADSKDAVVASFGFFGLIILCGIFAVGVEFMTGYMDDGNWFEAGGTLAAIAIFLPSLAAIVSEYRRPNIARGMEEDFARWDAFARAVKSSRLREYPPSSAVIWGEILVYASALGLADKVKRHMSELDALAARRIDDLETVRRSSRQYYLSAWGAYNLGKYGSRSGASASHGGFSSHSSGGWSSGGGGGFSGGSSGGGGFR